MGMKLTVTVQEPPGATLLQLLLCRKWMELAPAMLKLLMESALVPVLDTVTALFTVDLTVTEPKSRVVGDTAMSGSPAAAPAWLTVKVWPAMVTVPVRDEVPVLAATE